ncbi:hypothetical protein B0H19DRAFT_1251237 [Mycena capillaripes]|nr:hypothetical protein B0H19DRAFT_1251237 [Mycena capillaripes]
MIYRPASLDIFLLTAFPRLRRLLLTFQLPHLMHQQSQPLVNMICLFPALQELDLICMSGVLEDIPANTVPPLDLRSLALSKNSMGPILAWLDAVGHLPNIRSLILPCMDPRVLTLGALHHLDITLHAYDYTEDEVHPSGVFDSTLFDLSLHPNLLTLHINHFGWTDDQATQMITMIMNLAASALEHLSLDLDLGQSVYQSLDWAPLDAFLTQARFLRLKSVNFRCNTHGEHYFDNWDGDEEPEFDEEPGFLRKALPLLEASGILQTEWSSSVPPTKQL